MRTSMVQNNGTQNSKINFTAINATKSFMNANFVKPEFFETVKATKKIVSELSSSEISGLEHMYQKGSEILEAVKKLVDPEKVNIHLDQVGSSTSITGHKASKGFFSRGEKIEANMLEPVPNSELHDLVHVTPETLAAKIKKVSGLDTNA